MKKALLSIFLGLSLSFSTISYAQSEEATCLEVAQIAGAISQAMHNGYSISDLVKHQQSPEFKSLPKEKQELVKALTDFVFYAGKTLTPREHFSGAAQACMSFEGDIEELTRAINLFLSKKTI